MPRTSIATSPVLSHRLIGLLTTLVLGLGLASASPSAAVEPERERAAKKHSGGFRIATLNLVNTLGPAAVRHDVRTVINTRRPSVIGMQERRDTRPEVRAALPKGWRLRMPTTAPGTDDNPIAFDNRIWKLKYSWPRLLAKDTWRRAAGNEAIDQYGVVAVLEHRRSGHLIRAISFHMPSLVHNRATGGPNYAARDRLGAFWRMAASVRELARITPKEQQFIALCDCNVTESRDHSNDLVKGELTRPLDLENNYSAAGYRPGWRIDYVMAERRARYRISSWRAQHQLRTDHPAVVTKFEKR